MHTTLIPYFGRFIALKSFTREPIYMLHNLSMQVWGTLQSFKTPKMENIQEAPTLPFRTWAFLSPAPPERCKGKSVFARRFSLSIVTACADHHRLQHLSVLPGYYALVQDGRWKWYPYACSTLIWVLGNGVSIASQCFVSLCLSIGSSLVWCTHGYEHTLIQDVVYYLGQEMSRVFHAFLRMLKNPQDLTAQGGQAMSSGLS